MHILVIVGTRPEIIKMAPVVWALREDSHHKVFLCTTGQHRDMLRQMLADFALEPDISFDVMSHNQDLTVLTSRLLESCDKLLIDFRPDWVLVQGDTSTVMVASLVAFYQKIKIGHIEAGLRSFNKYSPFPEEVNRKITGVLADLHFAPTENARTNLLNEGIATDKIIVTGNTVIDTLFWVCKKNKDSASLLHTKVQEALVDNKKILLITCHRRESFGIHLTNIMSALSHIAETHPECLLVYPVHPNPNIQDVVQTYLANKPNVLLLEPLSYSSFLALLNVCYIVISDSGGIQEEAAALHKPAFVLREVTERSEGVVAGVARLVGNSPQRIFAEINYVLNDQTLYRDMIKSVNPYGDGRAAERIKKAIYE